MINMTPLTKGCIPAIRGNNNNVKEPVLQVLGTKKVTASGGCERYRLLLSDGQYLQTFAMLATHLNDLVVNGDLSDHTIIRVKSYTTTYVGKYAADEKFVLIITNLEVLHKGEEVGSKIGEPVCLDPYIFNVTNPETIKQTAELRAKIAQLEAQNIQQRAEIDAKDAKITEQGRKITELVTKIADHGVKIEQLETSIAEVLHMLPE